MFALFIWGIVGSFVFYNNYTLWLYILFIGIGVVISYVNYHIFQVRYTAEELEVYLKELDRESEEQKYLTIEKVEDETKSVSVIKKGRREEIIKKLYWLLDEEKIFLRKDLRMDDIVRLTLANRTYISSEEFGYSFSELINRRRIDYARQIAAENPHLSHIQIAEESGFTHPVSFSRTFKQYVGVTFRQWHKTI